MSERRILDTEMTEGGGRLAQVHRAPDVLRSRSSDGPDRTVLTVAVPARDALMVADLERMRAMIPRPIDIVVVPDAWIEEPLRIEEPLSFVLRRIDMGRIRSFVDFDLPFSDVRVIEIPDPTPSPRRSAAKGWRRHVRRMKAAGLWRPMP
jgi:hypothetical protein